MNLTLGQGPREGVPEILQDIELPYGGLCYVGSLVTGGLQLRQNRLAAENTVALQVTPTGVVLSGRF